MLIRVSGTTIVEFRDVNPIEKESEIMKSDPSFIATNYNFTESLDLHEYVDNKVHLVSGWETIKATRAAKQDAVNQSRLKAVGLQTLREQRNQLLTETDWTASTDVTMSPEMTEYRKLLRDLPANTADVFNPVYPDKPN